MATDVHYLKFNEEKKNQQKMNCYFHVEEKLIPTKRKTFGQHYKYNTSSKNYWRLPGDDFFYKQKIECEEKIKNTTSGIYRSKVVREN